MQGSFIARRPHRLPRARPVFGALLALGLALSGAASHASVLTGPLSTARQLHAAATLPDGRIFVVGGVNSTSFNPPRLASSEIYDPTTGTWSAGAALNVARDSHGLVALADGRILAVGGNGLVSGSTQVLASAEIYDPVAGTWTLLSPMNAARVSPGIATLADGRVLIVGGDTTGKAAEIFDPLTNTFTAAAASLHGRIAPGVAVLADGRVLLAGGYPTGQPSQNDPSSELWDPATGAWTLTGTMRGLRSDYTLTTLANGKVLAAGGFAGGVTFIAKAELYDPAAGTWSDTGTLNTPRVRHVAQRLDSGNVLINGGYPSTWLRESSSEVYDVASGTWRNADWMTAGRNAHTVARLPNGDLLFAGGGGPVATSEILHPGCASAANALMPSSQSFAQAGGAGSTSLTVPVDCPWTLTSVPAWVSLSSSATGTGSASITYNVAAMTAYGTRSAKLHVADQTLTIDQIGACDPTLKPTLTPSSRSFPLAGGSASISVTFNAACTWSVTQVPAWITITSGASGQGNGTVTYTVAANAGSQRTALMNIKGRYHVVDQAGN